jgi:formylglycine-generating enzyme required for sulfatase activity
LRTGGDLVSRLAWFVLPATLAPLGFVLVGAQKPAAAGPGPLKVLVNSVGMKLVRIPAGKFTMGSPQGEKDRDRDERQHQADITRPFYLGAYEVTQGQYRKVIGRNPSAFCASGEWKSKVKGLNTDDFPVDSVSWEDAVAFCKKLSLLPKEKEARRVYRLPTEAEWEYACRAGTTTPFHFGMTITAAQANFGGTRGRTGKVGLYAPNAFGLYDMHGNVMEWCGDGYDPDSYKGSPRKDPTGPATAADRVVRGGGWRSGGYHCRSASRGRREPTARGDSQGFRVALAAE